MRTLLNYNPGRCLGFSFDYSVYEAFWKDATFKKPFLANFSKTVCIHFDANWAADPKGTMSYRTEEGISVRPSVRPSERTSGQFPQAPAS